MGAYPSALDAGMTPKEFWESTVAEIRDRLKSYGRRETARARCAAPDGKARDLFL